MRDWLAAAVAIAAFVVVGCERKGEGEKEKLSDLAITFWTAETYDEWTSCLEPESAEMFVRGDKWEKHRLPPVKKEDVKITKIEVLGDAAIIHSELKSERSELWAIKNRKWFLTFERASRGKSISQEAMEKAWKAQCRSNLMLISRELAEFQKKRNKPPTTWEELFQEAPHAKSVLRCPSAREREIGYVLSAGAESKPADTPVVTEPPSNHAEGWHVLYADGRIEWNEAEGLREIPRRSSPAGGP